MAKPSIPLTAERLRELVHYDPETGEVRWLKKTSAYHSKPLGLVTTVSSGYLVVRINYQQYKVHNLIWLYVTGEWPRLQIDHRNRNSLDNRWCNLRQVTISEQQRNQGLQRNNTSGTVGVCWDKRQHKWRVYFGHKHIGVFADKDEAIRVSTSLRQSVMSPRTD